MQELLRIIGASQRTVPWEVTRRGLFKPTGLPILLVSALKHSQITISTIIRAHNTTNGSILKIRGRFVDTVDYVICSSLLVVVSRGSMTIHITGFFPAFFRTGIKANMANVCGSRVRRKLICTLNFLPYPIIYLQPEKGPLLGRTSPYSAHYREYPPSPGTQRRERSKPGHLQTSLCSSRSLLCWSRKGFVMSQKKVPRV